jgi:hypothetical protein
MLSLHFVLFHLFRVHGLEIKCVFFPLSLSLWQLGLCWNGITIVCQQGMDRGLQHPRALDH